MSYQELKYATLKRNDIFNKMSTIQILLEASSRNRVLEADMKKWLNRFLKNRHDIP